MNNIKKSSKSDPLTILKKYQSANETLTRMCHSSKSLHKAIVSVLKQLPLKDDKGQFNTNYIELVLKYRKIVRSLQEVSRCWFISSHFIYTVCLPRIVDQSNPSYSPIYSKYAGSLPSDQFGELDHEDIVVNAKYPQGVLVKRRDRLVGDKRIVPVVHKFGSAWDGSGNVVKRNPDGTIVLDGFAKYIAEHIDKLVKEALSNSKRDRHVQAFMVAHTRDPEAVDWSSEPRKKETHMHELLALPAVKSRYQIMEGMGFDFSDFTYTFLWIKGHSSTIDELYQRASSFVNTLQGALGNYQIPDSFQASAQYLIHASRKARNDSSKATYSTNEVITWLPDDPDESYESIADVYDNEAVAKGMHAEVIHNLKYSNYNRVHHVLERYVGVHEGDKAFTFKKVEELRKLGKKQPGRRYFSRKSKDHILNLLISWIRTKKIEFGDWQLLLHAAFNDEDADALIADTDFVERINAVLDAERQAIIADPGMSRDMTTYCIFAKQGGIGKTRLANSMALQMDKYRKPYSIATKNKKITFDPFQDYENETSTVMDELNPGAFSWSQLKDLLDPHKIPFIGSRYHNKSPFNLRHMFITDVFANGIADYVTDVLKFSEGVSELGYLQKDGGQWSLITNDIEAGSHYVSQLSQLLRRLPIVITLDSTANGLGTSIKVSVINFQPGGRNIDHYDYVHTQDSVHVFKTIINDDLPDQKMENIAKQVIKMTDSLVTQAKEAFQTYPGKLLDEVDGFIADGCDFLVRYTDNHDPVLVNKQDPFVKQLFSTNSTVTPRNLISTLNDTQVFVWPGTEIAKSKISADENQLDAFIKGYEVPIAKVGYDQIKTVKLTEQAVKLLNSKQSTLIWKELNSQTAQTILTSNCKYLSIQLNRYVANFKIKKGC